MSTGKRLAKRSIIGTRVCAPGPDGLWYSGVIQDVKTPTTNSFQENNNCINLTPDTKYSVRFDFKTQAYDPEMMSSVITTPALSVRLNAMIKEFHEHELIGPGFRSIMGVQLHTGQRVFLTYNGREISGDVILHDIQKDEVVVKIAPIGYEEPMELKKRLDEVRLLESRRSARLADQERDTDFARLADMGGERRRASHSIDVPLPPTQHNPRKRRPSCSFTQEGYVHNIRDDDQMDECNAALVLMKLSCSPHSPQTGPWNRNAGSSPGSSSASWSSGSSSPPLSDDGAPLMGDNTTARIRTASLSTSDEGIVMDYSDETPRKRRAHGTIFQCTWKGCGVTEITVTKIEAHVRTTHLGPKKPRHSFDDDESLSDSDHEEEFYYTEIEEDELTPSPASPPTLSHRDMARPPHEDPEYQRKIVGNFREGLKQLQQSATQRPTVNAGPINIPTSPLAHHNYTWAQQSPISPHKQARWSPRPSTSSAPYPSPTYVHHFNQHAIQQNVAIAQSNVHSAAAITSLSHSAPTVSLPLTGANSALHHSHHNAQQHQHQHSHQHQHQPQPQPVTASHLQSSVQTSRSPQSPNRRARGENKKCRKVYGMDNKDQWCTQCKWKKACSRFGD